MHFVIESKIFGNRANLTFKVIDTGIGIKKADYEKLFQKFERLDQEQKNIQGTGLGLTITKKLVDIIKEYNIDKLIVEQTRRGVTKWDGVGAYTKDSTNVLVSCVSKYEVSSCIDSIHKIDPQAFIVADEHVYVSGNFEKRVE